MPAAASGLRVGFLENGKVLQVVIHDEENKPAADTGVGGRVGAESQPTTRQAAAS